MIFAVSAQADGALAVPVQQRGRVKYQIGVEFLVQYIEKVRFSECLEVCLCGGRVNW